MGVPERALKGTDVGSRPAGLTPYKAGIGQPFAIKSSTPRRPVRHTNMAAGMTVTRALTRVIAGAT